MVPARRALFRKSYKRFFKEFAPWYIEGLFHVKLFNVIQDISNGIQRRVLIDIPPRHTKSEIMARKGIPYLLGKRPDLRIIYGSYSDDLPGKFSRECRRIIKTPKYQEIFPDTRIEYGSDNIKEWITTMGGAAAWVGVQGGATGKDADVIIIDDPLKNRKEAESETMLKSVDSEINASFITRLEPGGSAIIIQTRWSQDDPVGKRKLDDSWEHIHFAANSKEDCTGDWLFPDRFTTQDYLQKKKDLGSYDWNSLYMGNPRPPEGGVWKRSYARIESAAQHQAVMKMNWSLYYDLAFSSKMEADETVGAEFLEWDNVVYVRRPRSTREDMAELKAWLSNDIISRGVKNYGVDKAFSQSQFARELRLMKSLKLVRQDPLRGVDVDKLTNFLPMLARFEAREVVYIQEPEWSGDTWDTWVEDLAEYKPGQKKSPDRLDCLSNGYRMINSKRGLQIVKAW